MNINLIQSVRSNPQILRMLDIHGIELATLAFEILIATARTPRDDHGHFYSQEGAACPHGKGGGTEPPETEDSVKRKEAGVSAFKSVLKHGGSSEMTTAAGRKVAIEYGNEKYGAKHFEMRRTSKKWGDGMNMDKLIDGVSKALATAEPYENRGNIIFKYKGFIAVCFERNKTLIFKTGYDINEFKHGTKKDR